ncbi:MAG: hypothetical protein WAP74_01315 [Patescibacteria group bacterium]
MNPWLFAGIGILYLFLTGLLYDPFISVIAPYRFLIGYQFFPILVAFGLLAWLGRRLKIFQSLAKQDVLIILAIAAAAFGAHSLHLQQYFFKEDIAIEIGDVINPSPGDVHANVGRIYPLALFSTLFLIFGNDPGAFVATGLIFQIINSVLIFLILKIAFRNTAIAAAAAALWATTPAFLESFIWLGISVNSGLAIMLALLTLLIAAAAMRQNLVEEKIQALLATFLIATLNYGFVRVGVVPLILPFMGWTGDLGATARSVTEKIIQYRFPVAVGVSGMLILFTGAVNFSGGQANVLGNRTLDVGTLATTFFTLGAVLFPPQVQQFFVSVIGHVDAGLSPEPWYIFHIVIIAEMIAPLALIAFVRDKKVRAIALFGYAWFVMGLVPMVIGGGAINNIEGVYRAMAKYPYLPGLKQIQFAYIGYSIAWAAIGYALIPLRQAKTLVYAIVIGAVTLWLATTSRAYHKEFVTYQSEPLRELIAIINKKEITRGRYMLVFAPAGSPVNGFLNAGGELPYLTNHKELVYSRDLEEAVSFARKYDITADAIILVDYDSRTAAVTDGSATLRERFPQFSVQVNP